MASWIRLAVLSALAVSTLSLAAPDGAYNIPQVGTGRRSQYFVLHRDGTHKYGYDTGKGAFETAKSTKVGQQKGGFGYVDPDGHSVNLQYTAGEAGFVPTGAHLPQPHPDFHKAHAAARARPPFVDPLANPNADASYGFQFAGEGQTRSEKSDASGNVRGSYSYTDDDGITRTYSYTAGHGTGFVVEGNDLPLSPPTPESSGSTPAATRRSSSGTTISSSGTTTPHSGSSLSASPSVITYSSPANPSRPSSAPVAASGGSSGPSSPSQTSSNNDGSYAFSFNAGDHSRSESADNKLNVQGQFSFVADDGVRRRVNYRAGPNTGFTASGATSQSGTFSSSASSSAATSSSHSATSLSASAYSAPSSRPSASENFRLTQYDASKNPNKFGYVLTYD